MPISLSPAPRLPHELVLMILSSSDLSLRDLARCALLSRSHLGPVRRILYETVPVILETESLYPPSCRYACQSWHLLKVLKANSAHASLVRSLEVGIKHVFAEFDRPYFGDIADEATGVAGFLEITPNLAAVHGITYRTLPALLGWEDTIGEISVTDIRPDEVCDLSKAQPNLKRLHLTDIQFYLGDSPELEPILFPRLEVLDINTAPFHLYLWRNLADPTLTALLRVLRISVVTACDLDLGLFKHLHLLHLYPPEDSDWEPDPFSTWRSSLRGLLSLQTLSLGGKAYSHGWAETLFADLQDGEHVVLGPITSLGVMLQIFAESSALDRLNNLFASPSAQSARRLVIRAPGHSFSERSSIAFVCELHQVVLVSADF